MSPYRPAAAVLTALALLAGGCGDASEDSSEKFSGERRLVARTIEDLQDAGAKADADKICGELLSTTLIAKIRESGKSTCTDAVEESLKDVDAFELDVVENGVTVTGTTATARVKSESGDEDRIDTLQLVKEDHRSGGRTVKRWKVSALAG